LLLLPLDPAGWTSSSVLTLPSTDLLLTLVVVVAVVVVVVVVVVAVVVGLFVASLLVAAELEVEYGFGKSGRERFSLDTGT